MHTHPDQTHSAMTPAKALQFLEEGNRRFVANLTYDRGLLPQVNQSAERRLPMAAVLSCSDCAMAPEQIFDQSLGDVFNVRNGGNVLSEDVLGSLEYACALAGARLIVVLGHTDCGVVESACAHLEVGHLTPLLAKVHPSVHAERRKLEGRYEDGTFIDAVATRNAWRQMQQILDRSPLLQDLFDAGSVGFAAALFHTASGTVEVIETLLPTMGVAARVAGEHSREPA